MSQELSSNSNALSSPLRCPNLEWYMYAAMCSKFHLRKAVER